jgi:hypothetical protein
MSSYHNPENEVDVETYADISVACSGLKCGLEADFRDAFLQGDQYTLAFVWTCPNCQHKNFFEADTDKYFD